MTAKSGNRDQSAWKLSNNLSRLLVELSRDFKLRSLRKCHARGHTKIRPGHSSLFSHLGFDAVRLTELAERANITQQAMGKLVKEMEKLGYVQRQVDESDKRARIIQLTERGKQLVRDNMDIIDEVIAEYEAEIGREGLGALETALRHAVTQLNLRYLPTVQPLELEMEA